MATYDKTDNKNKEHQMLPESRLKDAEKIKRTGESNDDEI